MSQPRSWGESASRSGIRAASAAETRGTEVSRQTESAELLSQPGFSAIFGEKIVLATTIRGVNGQKIALCPEMLPAESEERRGGEEGAGGRGNRAASGASSASRPSKRSCQTAPAGCEFARQCVTLWPSWMCNWLRPTRCERSRASSARFSTKSAVSSARVAV